MNAGELNHLITIQELTAEKDAKGFETDTWTDYYTNYASKNHLYGNERWMAAQVQMDNTVRFTMRWHSQLSNVTPKRFRILSDGKIYMITNVDQVMYRNDVVKIDTMEVES